MASKASGAPASRPSINGGASFSFGYLGRLHSSILPHGDPMGREDRQSGYWAARTGLPIDLGLRHSLCRIEGGPSEPYS